MYPAIGIYDAKLRSLMHSSGTHVMRGIMCQLNPSGMVVKSCNLA